MAQRRRPERMTMTVHANLREDWFDAVSAQKGSKVLAVQTLRNALMSACARSWRALSASTGSDPLHQKATPFEVVREIF